ncbi:MAG: TetR family transcriptional regulator [Promethearchaeota archaeon]|nr:MAG: TetR family transcriptional regulator [Candidatus Lokiarchaeota archaeon]
MGNSNNREKIEEEKGTKERIRDAAIDMFSQKGYKAVSIREIADAVEIQGSSIYSHYKSKEDIMDTIITFFKDKFRSNSNLPSLKELMNESNPKTILSNVMGTVLELLKDVDIQKILRLMFIELYRNDKFLDFFQNQYIKPSYVFWTEIFQQLMNNGAIKEYDPKVLAVEFFNHSLYLLFEVFVLKYNQAPYDTLIDEFKMKITQHVSFIFDMVNNEKK